MALACFDIFWGFEIKSNAQKVSKQAKAIRDGVITIFKEISSTFSWNRI